MLHEFGSRRWVVMLCLVMMGATSALAQETYTLGPDSLPQTGVPKGKLSERHLVSTKAFPGTERDYWVYVPAQYDGKSPACLLVVQDGKSFSSDTGQFHVPIVLDNLIHKKQIPMTIAVFIDPGNDPAKHPKPDAKAKGAAKAGPQAKWKPSNRSIEYDTPTDVYSKFLHEEVLPEALKGLSVTGDPAGRAIMGSSSGGICAFTVAWNRPDSFRNVISYVGSFADIRGGHNYPFWIRKAEPRPIRMFMQDGSNDLDNDYGNWFLCNQQMFKALEYANKKADEDKKDGKAKTTTPAARYDVKAVWGTEGHNGKHGGMITPDALRWIFRDYQPKLEINK